jgi:hypothetical protein
MEVVKDVQNLVAVSGWEPLLIASVVVCQVLALVALCWLGIKTLQQVRDGLAQAHKIAADSAATLDQVRRAQSELLTATSSLTESASVASAAAATLAERTTPGEDAHTLKTILALLRGLYARIAQAQPAHDEASPAREHGSGSGATGASETAAAAQAAAVSEQRLGALRQAQAEADELKRRLEDRQRQVETLGRERRRFAEEAAQLAGVKASNEHLMAELKEKRQEARRLQSVVEPLGLELQALRSQVAVLQRQVRNASDPKDLEGALIAQTKAAFDGRLKDIEVEKRTLEDQLGNLRQELVRTQREKSFIEDHYLEVAPME